MTQEFKVITLCGSTKFKQLFIAEAKRLTLEGNIVLSVGLFGHSGDSEAFNPDIKKMLNKIHFAKISMSDAIYVINPNGYIGESTKNEIYHAMFLHKEITYLEQPQIKFESFLPEDFVCINCNNANKILDYFYPNLHSECFPEQDFITISNEIKNKLNSIKSEDWFLTKEYDELFYGKILKNNENYIKVDEKYVLEYIENNSK